MTTKPEIRAAQEADADILSEIGARTFSETFADKNTPEDMALYISETFSPELQLRELRDPRRRTAIAFVGEKVAGYSQLLADSREPSVTGSKPVELVRLYVGAVWIGKGLGAALMEACLALARREKFETFWLGVWEHNLRAQAFYKKYGFTKVGAHDFRLGNDVQTDWIMSRPI